MFDKDLGAGVCLGLLEERHAPELQKLIDRNRAHLRQWMPWLDWNTTVADSKAFIRGSLERFASGNGFDAGIWFEGVLAGAIGLHYINHNSRKTEIGYWLGAEFTGHGIMTKACAALLEHCFEDLKLHRVEIRCATQNLKSCAIPERLGFTSEGIIRDAEWLYDHFVNHKIYGLLETEWQTSRNFKL
jgi:ribosomal-protein-serine acetyltransferase